MIDNIRFNFTVPHTKKWLDSLGKHCEINPISKKGIIGGYRGKIYFKKGIKVKLDGSGNPTTKKMPFLFIEIKIRPNKELNVIISNSLRKWYFNDSFVLDFNKDFFLKCLKKLSSKLNVPMDTLVQSVVTKVEYGCTISLPESYRCFYLCIYAHKHIPKKMVIGSETVKFMGTNKSVIFYDKITERKDSHQMSAVTQKSLNNKRFVLRYEIIKHEVNAQDAEFKYMKNLEKIVENWDSIIDLWVKELDSLTFVNHMNPEIYKYLDNTQIKDLRTYLVYLGIESLGTNALQTILSDRAFPKKRSDTTKHFLKIYDFFRDKLEQFEFGFMLKLKATEKGEELKA